MKRITIIFMILGLLVISAFVYVRRSLGTPGFHPATQSDSSAATAASASPIDLRPRLITKLQQLVKEGSDGLYNLSIHEISPDVLASTVMLKNISLTPDNSVLRDLQSKGLAPADVFSIRLGELDVDGLGLKEMIDRDALDIKSIIVKAPIIEVVHIRRAKERDDARTLYQKVMKQLKHLAVDHISLENGAVISHKKNKTTRLNGVSVVLSHLLMDSSTQNDKDRFLFAKEAELSAKNFIQPTNDGLYNLKIASLNISASHHLVTAHGFHLEPRFSREGFQKKVKKLQERYDISVATLQLRDLNWWDLLNDERLYAGSADISGAVVGIYLDRSLPAGEPKLHKFPHQLIMNVPLPIRVAQTNVRNLALDYEEFNPKSGEKSVLKGHGIHGKIVNLTNMPDAIKKNGSTHVSASGSLLGIPVDMSLHLDLTRYRTGAFSAGLKTNGFDGSAANNVAEASAMFRIKRGHVHGVTATVWGDNYHASGKVLFLYNDLHITPLEKDNRHPGKLEKRNFTSFLANTLVIRNDNPKKGEQPREEDCSFTRDPNGSFFNLIWKTTFTGILKTIGAPQRLATEK
ncbi:MAG TPA: hypothetical protein VNR87_05675 [Flavisolibacter sp.]|nr:hypothetical protein [Flavisolibacter sp.]